MMAHEYTPPRSPRKRWSPTEELEMEDTSRSFYDDDLLNPPGSPSGAKRLRLERDSLSPNGWDSPFRAVTPDTTFELTMTPRDSPMLTGRELRQKYKKDELWTAIKSDYHYLMDEEIIETCKSTESDLSWDDEDLPLQPTEFSLAEFMQQYQEVCDWLAQTRLVLQRRVTNNSERYLNQIYHKEMLSSSPRRKLFNDYGKQLTLRYPGMREEISHRLRVINDQWTGLQSAIQPASASIDSSQLLTDVTRDLDALTQWLQQVETYLFKLTIRSNWSMDLLRTKIKEHQDLQTDIESHSKQISSVLKLCEKLQSGDIIIPDSCFISLQDRAVQIERRWHSIWLQSLEWQCRLEEAVKEKQGLVIRRTLHSSDPELWDSGDISASPQSTDQQVPDYFSDREYKTNESDSCADVIPFSADEYEKINSQTDDDHDHVTQKPSFSPCKPRVSFSIDEVRQTSTPCLRSGAANAATMMDPPQGDFISFDERKLQRNGKSESRDIGYSSEGYSNDELLDNSPRLWKAPSLGKLIEWQRQTDNSEMVSSGFLSEDKSGNLQAKDVDEVTSSTVDSGKTTLWRHSITSAYDTSSNPASEGEATQSSCKNHCTHHGVGFTYMIASPPKQFYKMTTIETDFSTDRNDTDDHYSDLNSPLNSPRQSCFDDEIISSNISKTNTDLLDQKLTLVNTSSSNLNNNSSPVKNITANFILDGSIHAASGTSSCSSKNKVKPPKNNRRSNTTSESHNQHSNVVTDSSVRSETDCRVYSSCEASGESNSETDSDDFSTASEFGLSSSVISASHLTITPSSHKLSHNVLSNTRCSKKLSETNTSSSSPFRRNPKSQPRRDRPWSIVGFSRDDSDLEFKPMSTSESAINGQFIPDNVIIPLITSTPKQSEDLMTEKYGIYSHKHTGKTRRLRKSKNTDTPEKEGTTNSSPYTKRKLSYKKRKHSSNTNSVDRLLDRKPTKNVNTSGSESGQATLVRGLLNVNVHSSTTCTSETDYTGEYLTPRETITDISSDEENPLNVTTFSENAWDNYQNLYPTVSEAPTEDALPWEPPHDEFEFDDEISIPSAKLTNGAIKSSAKSRHKEQPKYSDEDSDSDLDELHHMLQQSHDYLQFTSTSLHKHRTDPLHTGVSFKHSKYAEHVMTCETNLKCLGEVADHVDSSLSELCGREITQIDELIDQWNQLHKLARERHLQSRDLSAIYADLGKVKVILDEVIPSLQLGTFSDVTQLDEAIQILQDKCTQIDRAWTQLSQADDNIDTFSTHNPSVKMDGFVDYATQIHKSWNVAENLSSSQLQLYKDSCFNWRSFAHARRDITRMFEKQRQLLAKLDESSPQPTPQQLDEHLSLLKTIAVDLAVYEEKLEKLRKMHVNVTPVLTDKVKAEMDTGITRLTDERLNLHHWCQHTLAAILDRGHSGKAGDKLTQKLNKRRHFLHRLVNRATPVMFALVMLWITSPHTRDSILFSISPELSYVRGPPAT